ncbi:hypothetical protein [Actinokineospora iranica]|uniref:Uncharacterized protein n=1 Tax=Actinokineospora iranica TaxID=1271860 RepID=A0A1G6JLV3_9PSEU|nr:hypothetical protein [Actinokineospora iranica]SDC18926.1 hypothetical protein SAMN05216174_101438 [Actinokineospora iranica]
MSDDNTCLRPLSARTLPRPHLLPTVPCSVVWSGGHAFVLEHTGGGARWVGLDAFGRPCSMSPAALERQGWSRHRDD